MSLEIMKWVKNFMLVNRKKVQFEPTEQQNVYSLALEQEKISLNAIKVVTRLQSSGFQAYLIGGCVRDILLGHSPKDFDVVTNATPTQIRKVFTNCRIIGKRFLLAHILFRDEIIEVATFRRPIFQKGEVKKTKILADDNTFGTIDEDVFRRDFTLNALYYDPSAQKIVDLVGGLQDLDSKSLRVIGDPAQRFQEDPVRMIRTARYAAKLSLQIETSAKEEILKQGSLILYVPKARLLEEFHKCFFNTKAFDTLKLMNHFKIARFIVPREILKPNLIKSVGKACQWSAQEQCDKNESLLLVFGAFYFAFQLACPGDNKAGKSITLFFEKFSRLILVPKHFEPTLKKIIVSISSKSKLRGSVKDYKLVVEKLRVMKRKFF